MKKPNIRNLMTSVITSTLLTINKVATGGLLKNNLLKNAALAGMLVITAAPVQASPMTQNLVQNYANSMKQAANSKNVAGVAALVADDAIISLSRNGKTSNLGKKQYLQLLQSVWSNSSNYRYEINISNVVIAGEQARIQVETKETLIQNGQPMTVRSSSRATLTYANSDAVLLRAVTQVVIN